MKNKYTYMFHEKIYLKHILEIERDEFVSVISYRLSIKYISDYFLSIGDPNPIFWRHNYYYTKKGRDKHFDKLLTMLNKYHKCST